MDMNFLIATLIMRARVVGSLRKGEDFREEANAVNCHDKNQKLELNSETTYKEAFYVLSLP